VYPVVVFATTADTVPGWQIASIGSPVAAPDADIVNLCPEFASALSVIPTRTPLVVTFEGRNQAAKVTGPDDTGANAVLKYWEVPLSW
jgi:hypothetical protein